MDRKWSAAALLSSGRGLIFRAIKEPVLLSALASTAYKDAGRFDLNLSRSKVLEPFRMLRVAYTGTVPWPLDSSDEIVEMYFEFKHIKPVPTISLFTTALEISENFLGMMRR